MINGLKMINFKLFRSKMDTYQRRIFDTCRGKIYGNQTSKLCSNKAKDQNGFCLKHRMQSQSYSNNKSYEASVGIVSVDFKVVFNGNHTIIRMRHNHPVGRSLKDVNEKFGCDCIYVYDGEVVDLTLPAAMYDNKTLYLI